MKKMKLFAFMVALLGIIEPAAGQDNQTLFKNRGIRHSGGYAALTNQFTKINGDFANMAGVYGGWFINRTWMVGLGASATTNYIPVPKVYSEYPDKKMAYQYGQVGFMTEYTVASTKLIHVNFNLLTGAGFTFQYDRRDVEDWDFNDWDHDDDRRADFHFVVEPGVQVEVNLFKWMRFSPGISYRKAFGVQRQGLSDADLSNLSYNVTLKFGKF